MNRSTKTVTAVFGLGCVFSISVGGQCIGTGLWWHAGAAYAVAGILLTGIVREFNRSVLPGEYTDDLPEDHPADTVAHGHAPGPVRMGRFRAARAARRELRQQVCRCDRYWTSAGKAHDPWCPAHGAAYDRP